MEVIPHNSRGYKWTFWNGIYFRGYVQDEKGQVFRDISACQLFSDVEGMRDLVHLLKTLDGCFALVIVKESKTLAAVDIARSMPLYYDDEFLFISDNAEEIRKKKNIEKESVNPIRLLEIYSTDYCAFGHTAYNAISQMKMGSAAEFTDGSMKEQYYFHHLPETIRSVSRTEAIEEFRKISEEALNQTLKVVDDRQIALSLSGGYDSRYLACTLKKLGAENVLCYTYGKKNSFEIRQSKKVASSLGYAWYCIEYTDGDVRNLLSETDYIEYCRSFDFSLYIQNYIAVKKLVEMNILEKDAVFITGLCNDMPTGSYIPEEKTVKEKYGMTESSLAEYLTDERFFRVELKEKTKNGLIKETLNYMKEQEITVCSYQEFVSAYDCVSTSFDHSKRFLNMNKPHEYFDHEWLLPCWNRKLLNFWYSVPSEYRIHQNLYEEYIVNDLGKEFGLEEKKRIISNNTGPLFISALRRNVGGMAAAVLYRLGIPIRRKADINNFAFLELELYKKIRQKDAIVYKRAAVYMLLNIYMLEKNFGNSWFKRIKGLLK